MPTRLNKEIFTPDAMAEIHNLIGMKYAKKKKNAAMKIIIINIGITTSLVKG